MSNGRLRVGIVGGGLIARLKHIPALQRLRGRAELAAICDVNRESIEPLARDHGIPGVYDNLTEMLERGRLDVVDVCTPPRTHADVAVEAMRAGCHALIEKPMAHSVHDCDRIIEASRESGTRVCIAHTSLFDPVVIAARARVARGDIGAVRGVRVFLSTPTDYMTARETHWAHRLPGGVVGESAPHPIYLSLAFIQNVRKVQVSAAKLLDYPWSPFEDYRITLTGANGMSSIALAYASNQWTARFEVLGEQGQLLLDLEGQTVVHYRRPALTPWATGWSVLSEARQIAVSGVLNGLRHVTGRLRATHEILIDQFLESIRTGRPSPCSAEDGRETVRVLDLVVDGINRTESAMVAE